MSKMTGLTDSFIRDPGYRKALGLPDEVIETYSPLARGEYNINYSFAHPETMRKLILRVNTGSQMHLDRQIEYEAHALKLLSVSGRTPQVYYVDGSRRLSDHGILVMEFLPGRYPVYENEEDMNGVIKCLADIHCVNIPAEEIIYGEPFEVPRDTVRLIAPGSAIGAILDECEAMVRTYMETDIGSESVKSRLRKLLDREPKAKKGRVFREQYCTAIPIATAIAAITITIVPIRFKISAVKIFFTPFAALGNFIRHFSLKIFTSMRYTDLRRTNISVISAYYITGKRNCHYQIS